MAKKLRFDTSFNFGANAAKPKKKSGGDKKGSKRKPSGIRVWKGMTFGS